MDETQSPQDASESQSTQPQASQPYVPQQQQYAQPPQNDNPPATGTWLKLDARDPEAEAAEAAYLKESARVRRGVWIGNIFAFLVVGGALTGLGFVFIPKLGKPPSASAAQYVGTDDQRVEAATFLANLNGQTTMWKLQHNDRVPDFGRYPNWEQFICPTHTSGVPLTPDNRVTGAPVCGPYTQGRPVNPINGLSTVWVCDQEVAAGSPVGAGRPVGFVFHPAGLKFYVTDVAGTHVTDPSGPREAAVGKSRAEVATEQAAQEAALGKALDTFRAKLAQYQKEHNGSLPDFARYPGWDQLIERTDANGKMSESGQFGPYVERPLKNPYTGTGRVQVVEKHPGLRFGAASASVAWVLDQSSGKVWAVDAEGQLMPSK
jgi:hypothetical protein